MTKKIIRTKISGFDRYDLEGDLTEVVENLQDILNDNPDKKLVLELDYRSSYYDSVEIEAEIVWEHEETDEEYAARLAREESYRKQQEAYRRSEYEKLKKEFG